MPLNPAPASNPHIGYAAMLERFAPSEVLELAASAEQAGFTGIMATDHFQPWVPAQGQASFVWPVLGALGQVTTGDLGTGVTAPTFRSHRRSPRKRARRSRRCTRGYTSPYRFRELTHLHGDEVTDAIRRSRSEQA
ncbi:hypothetical protein BH11ACT4_BH11ACT4_18260 [soil metagenome]